MDTTAISPILATPPAPARGLPGIHCPLCGAEDSLRLRLHDAWVECGENDCEFDAAELRVQIEHYTALLRVLDALPVLP